MIVLVGNGGVAYEIYNLRKSTPFGMPYIVFAQGTELLSVKPQSKNAAPYIEAAKVITCSAYTRDLAVSKGVPWERISVLRPGCNPDEFRPMNVEREQFGVKDKLVLLTVGSLVERKGHNKVLQAIAQIKNTIPQIHYLIAGDGVYRPALEKICSQLGIHSYVTFLGTVEDAVLPFVYNTADVFIMPSREALGTVEGFGMVFIEAAACAKPCIAGNHGGMPEAVLHEKTGLIVDQHDTTMIAQAITRLLTDRPLAERMGIAGRNRVLKEFTWEGYYKTLADLLSNHTRKPV